MRVFLAAFQAKKKYSLPPYEFWERYFKRSLEEGGHEWLEADVDWVEPFTLDDAGIRAWKERAWECTLRTLRQLQQQGGVDLFLSYLFPLQVDPSAIREIRKLGIPTANFFCDNLREFDEVPAPFRDFDVHWGPERRAGAMYANDGMRYVFAPYPVWVPNEQRRSDHPEQFGVSFIGSRDIQRAMLLQDTIRRGVHPDIYGGGWIADESSVTQTTTRARRRRMMTIPSVDLRRFWRRCATRLVRTDEKLLALHARGRLSQEQYVAVTQQSRIALGINRYPSFDHPLRTPDTFIRLRDFEAPAMGACYLTEYTDGIDSFFDLEKEIRVYRSADDLVEQVGKLERDATLRRSMRAAALARAAGHSLSSTIRTLLRAIGA